MKRTDINPIADAARSRREVLLAFATIWFAAANSLMGGSASAQPLQPSFRQGTFSYRQRWFELYTGCPEQYLRKALKRGRAEAPALIRLAEIGRGECGDVAGSVLTKSELALLVLLESDGRSGLSPTV